MKSTCSHLFCQKPFLRMQEITNFSRSRCSKLGWSRYNKKVNDNCSEHYRLMTRSSLRVSEGRLLPLILTHQCQNETFLLQGLCWKQCLNSKIPVDAEVCTLSLLVSSGYWIWILNQSVFIVHRYICLIDVISAAHSRAWMNASEHPQANIDIWCHPTVDG